MDKEDKFLFGKRLEKLRNANGMTKLALSEAVSVSDDSIARWEKGEREPGFSIAVKLAAVLGTTIYYLAGETDNPLPPSEEQQINQRLLEETLRKTLKETIEKTVSLESADTPIKAEIFRIVRDTDDPEKLRKILEYTCDQQRLETIEKVKGA